MTKIFRTCAVLAALVVVIASCSKKKDPAPSQPSLDFSAVDKLLEDSVPSRFGGNVYVTINLNSQEIYTKHMGAYTASTKLEIANSTKWLTAAVIMTMVDNNEVALSDTIGKFLPIFSTYHKGQITITQLLSHTSGFPGKSTQGYERNQGLTLAQAVDLIAQNVALINPPGTKFYYGDVSMHVCGRIAEVVTGKDWKTLFRERIGSPIGMPDTDYGNTSNPVVAAGARSTPTDYIQFLNVILEGGKLPNGKSVLSENAVSAMINSQVGSASIDYSPYPPALIDGSGLYGLGNWRDADGENSSPGSFGCHPWVNFDKRVTGFVFTYLPSENFAATLPTSLEIRRLARNIVP